MDELTERSAETCDTPLKGSHNSTWCLVYCQTASSTPPESRAKEKHENILYNESQCS